MGRVPSNNEDAGGEKGKKEKWQKKGVHYEVDRMKKIDFSKEIE